RRGVLRAPVLARDRTRRGAAAGARTGRVPGAAHGARLTGQLHGPFRAIAGGANCTARSVETPDRPSARRVRCNWRWTTTARRSKPTAHRRRTDAVRAAPYLPCR